MPELAIQPAVAIYALRAVVLCMNILGLWGWEVSTGTATPKS
jgi:hypothetical protein